MVEFIYEDCITEQEKVVLQAIESLANSNTSLTVHDLMVALDVYSGTRSLGKYFIGSGASHIWIHRKNGAASLVGLSDKDVRIARIINTDMAAVLGIDISVIDLPEFHATAVDLTNEAKKYNFAEADHFVMTQAAWNYFYNNIDRSRFNYVFRDFLFEVAESCREYGVVEVMLCSLSINCVGENKPFAIRHTSLEGKSLVMILLFSESLKLRATGKLCD